MGGDSHTPTWTINLSHCDGSLSMVKVEAHLIMETHTLTRVPQSFLILFSASRPTVDDIWHVVSVSSLSEKSPLGQSSPMRRTGFLTPLPPNCTPRNHKAGIICF